MLRSNRLKYDLMDKFQSLGDVPERLRKFFNAEILPHCCPLTTLLEEEDFEKEYVILLLDEDRFLTDYTVTFLGQANYDGGHDLQFTIRGQEGHYVMVHSDFYGVNWILLEA